MLAQLELLAFEMRRPVLAQLELLAFGMRRPVLTEQPIWMDLQLPQLLFVWKLAPSFSV